MSDTFDHYGDALDSELESQYDDEPMLPSLSNLLRYHKLYRFTGIKRETAKAYLMQLAHGDVWVPKSICRHLDHTKGTVWLHQQTMVNMAAARAAQQAAQQATQEEPPARFDEIPWFFD